MAINYENGRREVVKFGRLLFRGSFNGNTCPGRGLYFHI